MNSIWADAMASLTGDASAQARIASVVKSGAGAYDSISSLIGGPKSIPVAPSPSAATGAGGASGLLPDGFSMAQIGVGLSAVAVVLWLALRRR